MIAFSSSAIQQLLNICHTYSTEHSLLYNGNKSFSVCFKPSTIKFTRPWFFFADMKIPIVTNCKYLCVIVSKHNSDNDLKRQMRKFFANANMRYHEISTIIKNIKSSSPGLDNLPPVLFKSCISSFIKPLTYIVNKSFESGIFPDPLKPAKIVYIFKSGDKRDNI